MSGNPSATCWVCDRNPAGGVNLLTRWVLLCAEDLAAWRSSPEKAEFDAAEAPSLRREAFERWYGPRKEQHRLAVRVIRTAMAGGVTGHG